VIERDNFFLIGRDPYSRMIWIDEVHTKRVTYNSRLTGHLWCAAGPVHVGHVIETTPEIDPDIPILMLKNTIWSNWIRSNISHL